ncbi:hypothetical protein ElyMa_003690400 [Elysia marginata]|uniref:Uncharacterized protein n=1 Tax=Elysia marginata TaxID=1093978 RepID=A0AAV4F1U9_9GAST|nr:hypothetical protein ElyMa_003690400 [Elysia marginata]
MGTRALTSVAETAGVLELHSSRDSFSVEDYRAALYSVHHVIIKAKTRERWKHLTGNMEIFWQKPSVLHTNPQSATSVAEVSPVRTNQERGGAMTNLQGLWVISTLNSC